MPGRSKVRYIVALWSVVLIGGYVFYVARENSRKGSHTERIFPGSKSRPLIRPSTQPEQMVLPSSKHALVGDRILYGDGHVTFEQNLSVEPAPSPTTKLSTAPSVK